MISLFDYVGYSCTSFSYDESAIKKIRAESEVDRTGISNKRSNSEVI